MCYSKYANERNPMFGKIKEFLLNEEKVDEVIWWTGYIVIGWILDVLAWIASKTKTTADDVVIATAKEKVKQAKKNKKK